MDVLSVKLNRIGLSHTSYLISIPMPEGRSDHIFLDENNDINKAKTVLEKEPGTYIKDHGIVTEVGELSCLITRHDGTQRKIFFAEPQDLNKHKGHVWLQACKDILHYMCVTTIKLGFQKMRVVWDRNGYPYLEVDKKKIIKLLPYRPVSPDGIGIGVAGFATEYLVDAFAPHIIDKRNKRNRENDTGTPIPFV